jgi:hypothetical protein
MQSNVPAVVRRQVKAAAAMQARFQAGQDPFEGRGQPQASPAPPAPAAPGPTIQPVPEFAVVGDPIPDGFVPVDLTRGDPRAATPPAPASVAAPEPPTNPSPRWTPASQASQAPQPAARQQVAPPAPAQTPPPGAEPVDNSDQRYRVLQGKYNSETRELRGQVADLIAANRAMMTALSQRPAVAPAPAPAPAPKTQRERALAAGFSEKEIEEYGEELVGIMLRTAQNVAGPQVEALRQENARLASTVQNTVQTAARTAHERFWDDIEELVPDWSEINASQEWLDWLQQRDVISGGTRNDGLQKAFAAHDARWAAGIFDAFKAEHSQAPQPTAGGQHIDPATLVAPARPSGGSPAPAGNESDTRIWTEAEVGQFYSDVRRGRIKGDAKARKEAEINQALRSGRIKPTHNDAHLINSR